MVWRKGWSGGAVRMVWLPFRRQMSCERGEVLGGRRFVLVRIWAGGGFEFLGFGFNGLYLAGVGEACPGLYGTGETLYGEGVGVGET